MEFVEIVRMEAFLINRKQDVCSLFAMLILVVWVDNVNNDNVYRVKYLQ